MCICVYNSDCKVGILCYDAAVIATNVDENVLMEKEKAQHFNILRCCFVLNTIIRI